MEGSVILVEGESDKEALWTSWRKNAKGNRVARYACVRRPGHSGCGRLTVTAKPLDQLIRDAIITAITGPRLTEAIAAQDSTDKEEEQAARILADAEARRAKAAGMFAAGDIDRREWIKIREVTQQRITDATRILGRHRGPLTDLPADQAHLRKTWNEGTLEWRRALITTVADTITVNPVQRPTNTFDPNRVHITWKA